MLISLEQQVSKILGICAIGSWFLCANCFDVWRASPDLCCLISIPLFLIFFYEHIIFPNNWQLFWALCAVGCFDMCYAISWSTWNKYPQWLSTMLYISLCLCYFRTNGGLFAFWVRHESCTFFFLGQGRSFILSCHLNMQPIFLLPCSN